MTYYESAKDMTVTRERALAELAKHGVTNYADFFAELGDYPSYEAQAVLQWLGY